MVDGRESTCRQMPIFVATTAGAVTAWSALTAADAFFFSFVPEWAVVQGLLPSVALSFVVLYGLIKTDAEQLKDVQSFLAASLVPLVLGYINISVSNSTLRGLIEKGNTGVVELSANLAYENVRLGLVMCDRKKKEEKTA
jgi:hypothetical protein